MNQLKVMLRTVRKESPILFSIVLINLLLTIGCIVGLLVDNRSLMGVNVWIKPLKFAISTGIYILTVGFLITLYPYTKRKKNIINNIVSWTLLVEMIIIVTQAARGVQSHYNMSSPLDGMLFAAMGILIAINVLIMVLFAIDSARLRLRTPRAIQIGILLGWLVVIFGSWVGGQMIGQMAHNVGVADGGEGLPLLNWSTIAGDLRVAHFFGLHGIQIIPLFALLLYKKWNASSKVRIISVVVFGLGYAAWIGFTFYQASKGIALLKL
ncbi:MAG: hypothetical protein AB3N14_00795 [Flavobacteriaceae bacterium]